MIRAIVFDLYDTLIFRDEAMTARDRVAIAAVLGVSAADLNRLSRERRDDRMLGVIPTIELHYQQLARDLGAEVTEEAVVEAARLERASLRQSVGLYAQSLPTIQLLRGLGFRLGLLSNASDTAALPLEFFSLVGLFDAIVLSHLEGLLKPDPSIYRLMCQRLAVEPRECAYVADGGFGELDAAHDLGMLAIKVEQDGQSSDYGSSTYHDLLLRDMAELVPLATGWQDAWQREG
ncbi:MAG: HAD family hydrolase [Chloroflexota bacterium]